MKVLVKTALSPYSGYGQDGLGICRALLSWGADVYVQSPHVSSPLPKEVAMLLTKHLEAPFDLAIVHQDPMQLKATRELKAACDLTVGWTMWEWDRLFIPDDRVIDFNSTLNSFDVLAVYDDNTRHAVKEYATGTVVTVQGGYDPADYPVLPRDFFSTPFRFCMQGALHQRKGVFVAIEAFKELKDEVPEFATAELHLKTVEAGLHPAMEQWCPGLKIYHEVWRHDKLIDFYRQMHVMLCPSRGEGKNLPALQFLSTGAPVIATNWGGHTGWLNDMYAYPLNYTLRDDPQVGARQAEPDKRHLKELMLRVFFNRAEVKEKGLQAARTVPLMCSWDSVLPRLFNQLADVHPKGSQIRDAAMRCRMVADKEMFEHRKKSLLGSSL